MIITCPDCSTRYDVDDDRFIPNGRSVRCTACTESWFVPAPEDLDMAPIEDLTPSARIEEKGDDDQSKRGRSRLKVRMNEESSARSSSKKNNAKSKAKLRPEHDYADQFDADYDDNLEDDDDDLFGAVLSASKAKGKAKKVAAKPDKRSAKADPQNRDTHDDVVPAKGWRKGRQFIVEDDDEPADRRPFFSRVSKKKNEADEGIRSRAAARAALRFREDFDDLDEDDSNYRTEEFETEGDYVEDAQANDAATIVDADWEDVADQRDPQEEDRYFGGADQARGFGRRIRTERRRATAIAHVEDARRFDPAYFDEEFFASLRVTPRELERAVSKARRRAESRAKNRMTPLRAFGWSAWVAAVAGTLYAVVAYRDDIVAFAPQTAEAYAVIGIEANPNGLAIENVRHRLAMSTGGPTIEITGNLTNANEDTIEAPLLQAEALGPRGKLLSRWTFTPAEAQITPGGAVEFMTRAPAPEGVVEVALSFAPTNSAIRNLVSGSDE